KIILTTSIKPICIIHKRPVFEYRIRNQMSTTDKNITNTISHPQAIGTGFSALYSVIYQAKMQAKPILIGVSLRFISPSFFLSTSVFFSVFLSVFHAFISVVFFMKGTSVVRILSSFLFIYFTGYLLLFTIRRFFHENLFRESFLRDFLSNKCFYAFEMIFFCRITKSNR